MRIQDWERNGTRSSRSTRRTIALLSVLITAAALTGGGQSLPFESVGFGNFDPRAVVLSAPVAPARSAIKIREIRDPHTGIRWRLLPNAVAPGGPARMVPSVPSVDAEDSERVGDRARAGQDPKRYAIQPGDRVVVEEHSRAAEAYLEAVALGPAKAGSSFNVRLKIGGKVVRAVAIAPGSAALIPAMEGKR
jgi:hypothetical protein